MNRPRSAAIYILLVVAFALAAWAQNYLQHQDFKDHEKKDCLLLTQVTKNQIFVLERLSKTDAEGKPEASELLRLLREQPVYCD